mmetsp:Transcript_5890/g.8245  ORF Transcript_5890/g.8245 Transcript_5890/m.8245 type:complete len:208 (+) Transcript_5890:85-708(+)
MQDLWANEFHSEFLLYSSYPHATTNFVQFHEFHKDTLTNYFKDFYALPQLPYQTSSGETKNLKLLTEYRTYFWIEHEPEPFQRKSYPTSKRKENRYFKPSVIRILVRPEFKHSIQQATAMMKFVDDNLNEIALEEPKICEMDETKSFCFCPTACNTSKGKQWRLQFTINFLLEDGRQKTEVLLSNKFRIVSRITQKHQVELYPWMFK